MISIAIIQFGCSTTQLTDKGKNIVFIRAETADCKELGRIFAQNWWDGNPADVRNKLKNEAAEMGGNALLLENRPPWANNYMRNDTYGLVFDCNKQNK